MQKEQIIGILLVGGESSRFGGQKAFAMYKDIPLFQYSLQILKECCDEVVIISHPNLKARLEEIVDVKIIEDIPRYKGLGPLAGIYSGMNEISGDLYMVLPCDTPMLDTELMKKLLQYRDNQKDAVVPKIKGKLQPLIAVYAASAKGMIQQLLDKQILKMATLLKHINVTYVSEDDIDCTSESFENVNFRDEYEKLIDTKK
ncbi:molybdenum cofactor guanylyltransferase [Bacillus sp. PS06]|uniref:molybdenum cofactor guanylyltransferase n=1 Tax=Bacillus sp. PS06 TaxID=2764176 RepID=UPI0017853959|nr:molybdenum cofactor guanylyltransferase [Bacillus sp. PS06]MBD8067565.1 molybdenum cofactor guanylyltransferase [Bacillus sp. PS06]